MYLKKHLINGKSVVQCYKGTVEFALTNTMLMLGLY